MIREQVRLAHLQILFMCNMCCKPSKWSTSPSLPLSLPLSLLPPSLSSSIPPSLPPSSPTDQMLLSITDQVIIFDEAHNMEDSSREAASLSFTSLQLLEIVEEIQNISEP